MVGGGEAVRPLDHVEVGDVGGAVSVLGRGARIGRHVVAKGLTGFPSLESLSDQMKPLLVGFSKNSANNSFRWGMGTRKG